MRISVGLETLLIKEENAFALGIVRKRRKQNFLLDVNNSEGMTLLCF